MATRSAIARKNKDGSYTGIYCHWDGYPSNNGKILLDHYQTDEKIDALISLGNISSLGKLISPENGENHTFDRLLDGVTVAYYRDRGEALKQHKGESLIDVLSKIDHEWAYVWINGKWEVWGRSDACGISIEDAIKLEFSF